tara:strand:- start:918 stop:1286 length:369 start_codon:yes stop_codon:yes gene_type:complete
MSNKNNIVFLKNDFAKIEQIETFANVQYIGRECRENEKEEIHSCVARGPTRKMCHRKCEEIPEPKEEEIIVEEEEEVDDEIKDEINDELEEFTNLDKSNIPELFFHVILLLFILIIFMSLLN